MAVVAVRLLIPFSIFDSSLSVLNIVDIGSQSERIGSSAVLPPSESAELTEAAVSKEIAGAVNDPETSLYPGQGAQAGSVATQNDKASLKDILYTVWLIGAVAMVLWFVLQNIWFYTRLRKTREAADISSCLLPVYLSRHVKSPCLFGLFRPAIYIHPHNLSDEETVQYILAHEETHYRHGDHLWSYLRCLCLALHWFNPLVWWAAVLSRRDCEIACDESTLNRIGDEHRKAYGNTLISMIEHSSKPSDLLCGATTMSSGESGIKERITMIATKPKMLISTLFAIMLITAAVVGCTFTGASRGDKDVTLYERAGVTIAIPNAYADQLLIDPVEYDDDAALIRVYQKSAYEKYEGMGFLFSIARYTEAQYEQFLVSDRSGQSFFAKDATYYYGFFHATDVQAPDNYEAFGALFSAVGDYVKSDMIERNGLIPYDDAEFFDKTYTYGSEHIFFTYYPYYAYNGSKEEVRTLILSQPVTQGDTGIWCVERWKDQYGNIYPYFPNENGTPAKEYYAALQAECDAGKDTAWLDPEQAALAFARRVFNHDAATLDSFTRSDNPAAPSDLFAASTGDIHDYMPALLAGEAVSDYELLPCLENFTPSTWHELDEAYGREWWDPLRAALRDAAVSDRQAASDDQTLRDYYIGRALLASDGAYTGGLSDIQALQWNMNSALYSACLNERFSADEAAALRRSIVYSISSGGSMFGVVFPESGGSLYLNAYPVDFPFELELAEESRESFRAESFGPVNIVESDGLQVTYLTPADGVYTVITIRTVREGCSASGVAVGDTEEYLQERWAGKTLKKLDGISYDDEAWFGKCDLAYAYTPGESTKSAVFLIKDGLVYGIEIVNGLDGVLY